jgi:hypothetical protein
MHDPLAAQRQALSRAYEQAGAPTAQHELFPRHAASPTDAAAADDDAEAAAGDAHACADEPRARGC